MRAELVKDGEVFVLNIIDVFGSVNAQLFFTETEDCIDPWLAARVTLDNIEESMNITEVKDRTGEAKRRSMALARADRD